MAATISDVELYIALNHLEHLHHRRSFALMQQLGIYPGQAGLLYRLSEADGRSQQELADLMHIRSSTMTVMLSRVEALGLIERQRDQQDQRIVRIFLTDAGREAAQKARERLVVLGGECFSTLTAEERRQLLPIVRKISAALEQAPADDPEMEPHCARGPGRAI